MRYDRDIFFDTVRDDPFDGSLTEGQVEGLDAVLDAWEHWRPDGDVRHLAYMLATDFHETAQTMQPIEEYGKGEGKEYGEVDQETGQAYYGRGLVQLTWRENYARADEELLILTGALIGLEAEADKALHPLVAVAVMFLGMERGWFTTKKLSDYFNEERDDPVNARQIINGNDKDDLIAGYHSSFMLALSLSQIPEEAAALPPLPVPEGPEPFVSTLKMGGHEVVVQIGPEFMVKIWVDGEPWDAAEMD